VEGKVRTLYMAPSGRSFKRHRRESMDVSAVGGLAFANPWHLPISWGAPLESTPAGVSEWAQANKRGSSQAVQRSKLPTYPCWLTLQWLQARPAPPAPSTHRACLSEVTPK